MSDASSGGYKGLHKKAPTVDKKPPKRKDIPASAVPGVGAVHHAQAHPAPAPAPAPSTWTRPIGPVGVKPTPPPTPYKGSARQQHQHLHNQQVRRAAAERRRQDLQAARLDALSFLGQGPRRTLTSVGFAPSPQIPIGPRVPVVRDSGVANNPGYPSLNGIVLSPRQITQDIAAVLRPGHARRKMGAIERLHAAGVSDPFGSTTHREGLAQERAAAKARRAALEAQAWELQKIYNANDANIAVSPREFAAQIAKVSDEDLAANIKRLSMPDEIQKAGFDPTSIGGLILGTSAKLGDAAREVTGSSTFGNALHDVAMWPTWAVPAAYSAINDPAAFVQGLGEGVIGHALRGDWEGAGEAFKAHPVFSLAEIRGGQALLGRAVAAPIRQASRGRLLGTQRAPLNLTMLDASGAYKPRSYNKEPLTRALQQLADKALTRQGLDVRVPGKGRVPARVLKRDLPVVGRALDSQRVHGIERLTDINRSAGISLERSLREGAQHVARNARYNTPVGKFLANLLDLPVRPAEAEGYHGVLGKIAAKIAPDLALDPVPMLVSYVQRGVIRHHPDGPGSLPTARSVMEDLGQVAAQIRAETRRPGAYRNLHELEQAQQTAAFLEGIRDSGRGLTRAVTIAKRLVSEFQKNDSALVRLGALDADAAARAPLFPAAMTRLGQEYKDGALRDSEGQVVPNEQIFQQLRDQGIDPEMITHLPHNELGRGAYHKQQSVEGRRNADTNALTGALWRRGASAGSWDHVVDSLVHGRTLAANIQTLDQFVHDLGTKIGDGTWKETVRAAESFTDKKGRPIYKAVRRSGSRLDADRREGIAKLQDVGEADVSLSERMLDDRLRPPEKDGPDVAVLVPVEAVSRARDHIKGGATVAAMQALSSGFRQTVLPFSTKWLTGNVAEAILRTLAVTVNPLDRRVARVALDRMIAEDALALYGDNREVAARAELLIELSQGMGRTMHPKQVRQLRNNLIDYAPRARAAEAELTGGLLYGNRTQTVRRTADEMGRVGQTIGMLGRAPIVNEFVGMTRWLAAKSFAFNRVLEREAQYTALGKHVRNEIQEFTGRWQTGLKLHEEGIEQVTKGLLGTPAQLKAANWLDETLGRYSRFSPDTRRLIQTYMPFLPWYLNAVRWTMVTIPFKHPIKTALLTTAERTFEQDWNNDHADKLERHGSLATSIKTKDGGMVDLARYTPFGLLGPMLGGKDWNAAADVVLPQFSGAAAALRGQDPFGRPLLVPKKYGGSGQEMGSRPDIALYQWLESVVPFLSIGRRLQEGGETALPTSTVWAPQTKPGSSHGQSAAQRVFDPFRPIYLRSPSTAGGGGGGTVDPVDAALDALDVDVPEVDEDAVDAALAALGG